MFLLPFSEPTESIYTKQLGRIWNYLDGDHIKETHLVATLDRTITRYGRFFNYVISKSNNKYIDLKQRQRNHSALAQHKTTT